MPYIAPSTTKTAVRSGPSSRTRQETPNLTALREGTTVALPHVDDSKGGNLTLNEAVTVPHPIVDREGEPSIPAYSPNPYTVNDSNPHGDNTDSVVSKRLGVSKTSGESVNQQHKQPQYTQGHRRSFTYPFALDRGAIVCHPDAPGSGLSSQGKTTTGPTNSVMDSPHDNRERKPRIVRKSSGEIVRPNFRTPMHRRASSMPSSDKRVQFDSHLEDIRRFSADDSPSTVSSASSIFQDSEDEEEDMRILDKADSQLRYPLPYRRHLKVVHGPAEKRRGHFPVHLQRIWLSINGRYLCGSVLVSNISFHKSVTCRFTVDDWDTVSEVSARYTRNVASLDQFEFDIDIANIKNVESKTLEFCIRYEVNGAEFWDNNSSHNYHVEFSRQYSSQKSQSTAKKSSSSSKEGQHVNGGTHSLTVAPTTQYPMSRAHKSRRPDNESHHVLESKHNGDTIDSNYETILNRLHLKTDNKLADDHKTMEPKPSSRLPWSYRYNFNASLEAFEASKGTLRYLEGDLYHNARMGGGQLPGSKFISGYVARNDDRTVSNGAATTASLPCSSYEDLLNKYCFVGVCV